MKNLLANSRNNEETMKGGGGRALYIHSLSF